MWDSGVLISVGYYFALFFVPFILYILLLSEKRDKDSKYKNPDWYYVFKRFLSLPTINKLKKKCRRSQLATDAEQQEEPRKLTSGKQGDTHLIQGIDQNGNSLFIKIILRQHRLAEAILQLKLQNGDIYMLPNEPEVLLCSIPSRQWRAEGLSITVVQPLHMLRLLYNGFLRNSKNGKIEHVKFNFIWSAADKPLYHPQDTSTTILADALAREPWRDGSWIDLIGDERGFEQYGVLQGFIAGDAFLEDYELYLPSIRKRYWGIGDNLALRRNFSVFVVGEDGTLLNIGSKSIKNGCSQMKYGTIINNIGQVCTIDQHDIDLEYIGEHSIPDVITIHVKGNKKTYKCILHLNHDTLTTTKNHDLDGWELKLVSAECILNFQHARAMASFWYSKQGSGIDLPDPLLNEPKTVTVYENLLALFSNTECKMTSLSGGKGSSLALLSSITSKNFVVPEGFVILTNAFNHQIKRNLKLKEAIEELEVVGRSKLQDDLIKSCQKVEGLFKTEPLCEELSKAIVKQLDEISKLNGGSLRWAVRSSGLNEDSEDVSAAGQNATFLGCSKKEDVLNAVAACWGSLFTYQSVQYRRQLGLDISCSMAVVIQRMVPADTAGVLFTCHPTTGNPSRMLITSNYGLGESVVSGQADPDTIVLKRTWNGDLSIDSQQIGAKNVVIKMSDNSIETDQVSEDQSKCLSLTTEQVLLIGKVGLELEKAYRSPRDIEWAVYNNKLYLLQSRPITTLNSWTDFELQHEFDIPILTGQEIFTVSNIGEVMPGALTPLSNTTVNSTLSKNIHKYIMNVKEDPFIMKSIGVLNHHAVINVANCFLKQVENKINIGQKVLDMAIFGHSVTNEKMHAVAVSRFGIMSSFTKFKILLTEFKEAFLGDSTVRKAAKLGCSCKINSSEKTTALSKFNAIIEKLPDLALITEYHSKTTRTSVFFQAVAMNILADGSNDLTMDHYYDISILLSSCSNVISVEIPQILEKISNLIIKSGVKDKFTKINPQNGVNWLRISCPQASQELEAFLDKHGHRGLREFELREDSWGLNASILIEMLQLNCKGNEVGRKNEYLSVDETVAKLTTPRNNNIRKVLRFLVNKSRNSVAKREATKSEFIRIINEFRIACRDLSKQMVLEGIIPDAGLLYFLSFYELKKIIMGKDPGIVRKSIQRQRLYPKWDKLKLPELTIGFPKLEEPNTPVQRSTNSEVSLIGTPACAGDVTARACVITDFADIDQLKAGDVLITYSTDVGWSPYFPILSAVVTELGGLISHGAVVAREYGLPCLVGAQNATSVFKTGDIVHVSGKSGILELISSSETMKQ